MADRSVSFSLDSKDVYSGEIGGFPLSVDLMPYYDGSTNDEGVDEQDKMKSVFQRAFEMVNSSDSNFLDSIRSCEFVANQDHEQSAIKNLQILDGHSKIFGENVELSSKTFLDDSARLASVYIKLKRFYLKLK